MKTATVDVDELNHHLHGSHAVDISFSEILLAGACGLNHLVYRPVANLEKAMGEMVRDIVDAFRFLESNQRMVVTALVKEIIAHRCCLLRMLQI